MSNLFKTLLSRLSIAYRGVVGGRLKKFGKIPPHRSVLFVDIQYLSFIAIMLGLKYDDLLIEQQDVMKALGRIDKTTLVERSGVNVAQNVTVSI